MEKELINLIKEQNLNIFNKNRTIVRTSNHSIYKTKDAKEVHNSVLSNISKNFYFPETSNLFKFFSFTQSLDEIKKRQEFFSKVKEPSVNGFLKDLRVPKPNWKPPYSVLVVTEDGDIYNELKELNCPVKILISEQDIRDLESSDIVQVVGCEDYLRVLEQLPQSVFLNSTDEVYLERYVSLLSGWKENIEVLKGKNLGEEVGKLLEEIEHLLPLCVNFKLEKLTFEKLNEKIEEMNDKVNEKIKSMSVSGNLLVSVLQGKELPKELKEIIQTEIKNSGINGNLFFETLPITLNQQEAERFLRNQDLDSFTSVAENIKKNSRELVKLPARLEALERELLLFDFISGTASWMQGKEFFPLISEDFFLTEAENIFLQNPQKVSFSLSGEDKCSILTGANSGGKTTLLEHIIQYLSCFQLGLSVSGEFRTPLFSEVYYFAKTKGSMNKGAFENLLTQMSSIEPGTKTLILADEIEAVTEPGVAGKMIAATAEYFLKKGCFLVIATHLGQEIAKSKPEGARIDGIEAKGLDEFNELIVDHNPILGRLASSTPELIVEKMAKVQGGDYFQHLYGWLKK